MIKSLSIKNYALIDKLDISFDKGLSTITGETGAGKSILIGALSLILGQRADTNILKNKNENCIVEGTFNIKKYSLNNFFKINDIDYDDITIIRRQINQNGKSRAFINDIPVNLPLLKELGDKLVDIHSQHHNLHIKDGNYQLFVIDSLSNNSNLIDDYKNILKEYKQTKKHLNELIANSEKSKTELDYIQFQYEQLEKANLTSNEQEELENEFKILNHAEEITHNLSTSSQLLNNEENSILSNLKEVHSYLTKLINFFPKSKELSERIDSTYVELKDISEDIENLTQNIEFDPNRIEFIKNRLDLIYSLQQKHNVSTIDELIKLKENLNEKLNKISSYDSEIDKYKKLVKTNEEKLVSLAQNISQTRKNIIPKLEKHIINKLQLLGMPYASFKVNIFNSSEFLENGTDKIEFLFSANKKIDVQEISKIVSGGELSRFMLTIKSLIVQSSTLPTIIFDEIDTGVSGEIADKMGNMMLQIADNIQVISITHIPQIAAKGNKQFVVFKDEEKEISTTKIKSIKGQERELEIAKMLSGDEITIAAIDNAKELLKK
ncbi:MAG: DNA repair protein RecN [Bacteroidales bacterium]|nr:DNA repair protein RecN [Bacteroidales bacterium]